MSAFYSLLEHEALLHITGPDSLTFLQGQTTCDTRKLDAEHALPGAYCTPQGRVVCDFLLAQLSAEHYALRMRADVLSAATRTFGKYIVFSKAELDAQRCDWRVVGCWGDGAGQALQAAFGTVPGQRYGVRPGDGLVMVQLDDDGRQIEVWIDMNRHPRHYEALQEAMEEAPRDAWRALQIHNGTGRIEAPTVEEFLPQTLNYDLTGFVSFDKGCYTGQEIVARLHYRGKPKRRMYLARMTEAAHGADAGAGLYAGTGDQAVGTLVNSAPDGSATVCLVAVTEAGAASALHLGSPDGPQLLVEEPPAAPGP